MDPSVAVVLKEAVLRAISILIDYWVRRAVTKEQARESSAEE